MRTLSLFCALFSMWAVIDHTEAIRCYSCQYSDGPGMVGYECVNSPADYNLGPNTVECETGCQTVAESINSWSSIWFVSRGCKTQEAGCQSGSVEICVETCDSADLCNDKDWTPTTVSTGSPTTTTSTTTATEIPGTRDCYSCLYSDNPDVPPTCVDDPANASPSPTVRCPPSRFCYIMRQWSLGENEINSFARGCEVQIHQNGCTADTFFQTCWTFCTDELCNSGDGTYPLKAISEDHQPLAPPRNE